MENTTRLSRPRKRFLRMSLKITRLIFTFAAFPLLSYAAFSIWAESIPSAQSEGSVILQYAFIYGATIACNNPALWGLLFLFSISLIVLSAIKKYATTYLLLNIFLFMTFCLPIFLAILGKTRFCISFLI